MQIVDRYAYNNRLRGVDPALKAGLAMTALLLCLGLDRPAAGLLAVAWMWGMTSLRAGLPAGLFGRLLMVEGLFLVPAALGAALSIGSVPPATALWQTGVGPWWLSFDKASVTGSITLATRAVGCASALNFLALTTSLPELTNLLRRVRTPFLLIELMTLVYGFLFTLLESLGRIRTAQECRLGYVGFRRGMSSAATLAGRLFLDAYLRSRRMQIALESRCYCSELRLLSTTYSRDWGLLWLGAAICASMLLARALG